MKRAKSDYRIHTIANAFRVVKEFEAEEEIGVTELSRRLSLHKNNVFRILATLEGDGFVEKSAGSERYRLGVAAMRLGQVARQRRSLVRLARPLLEGLAAATGETVHLGALRGFEVVHLDAVPADQLVGTSSRVGMSLPSHCTSLGKVLLAGLCREELERYDRERIREAGLARHTADTITDREKLLEHLHMVAAQGYALDQEECAPGLACAAAPVFDGSGAVVAALSVSGPAFRLDSRALAEQVVPLLLAAADTLSAQLGHVPVA